MESTQDNASDGTVAFLPHRLNRQPIVVRGLTADELWICTGLSATAGLGLGIPLGWFTESIAMIPTTMVLSIAAGLFIGGGLLRRQKRGRPETWFYRHTQWWLASRYSSLAHLLGAGELITRSGFWATRRGGA
ncbi:TIGR03750 family conjugal transfer protein [Pseudomonas synxantha]|uniref:Conjugative transfer region protein (TIGR03750 family) n=1 Tax=Pseudomonas synxantha TaxID=47883 RepID=A0ACC6JRZ0_9PSED|nr:TIGR03750 family conjugal transfer protein [Pseudomonas synxantha]MDR6609061.1 conjugative transfer region protein (TIGR03750 family) [Pseudomonas synxantha]